MQRKHDHPEYAWAALAALVVVADLTGNKTMSDAFRTASRHPVYGPPLIVGTLYLNAHLFGLISPRYDLFHRAFCRRCIHVAATAAQECVDNSAISLAGLG